MALALQAAAEPPANSQSKHSALTQPDVETASLAGITQRSRPLAFVGFSTTHGHSIADEGNGPIDRDSGVPVSSLTRLYINQSADGVRRKLQRIFDDFLITWRPSPIPNQISFLTVDKRRNPLTGDVIVASLQPDHAGAPLSMVIFNKGRGDAIEFKRLFRLLQEKLLSF